METTDGGPEISTALTARTHADLDVLLADLPAATAAPGSGDAPVIHVRGIAYKGTVEVTTRPPERSALR